MISCNQSDCELLNPQPLSNFYPRPKSLRGYEYACKHCQKRKKKQRYRKNPKKWIEKSKQVYSKNSEILLKYRRDYYIKNKEKENKRSVNYTKKWRRENPGLANFFAAKIHAARLKRTPKWLTNEQWAEINEFYTLAKELKWLNNNESLHVDHIVPLKGKNVSGLHVPWNLQILPASVNRAKSNKF